MNAAAKLPAMMSNSNALVRDARGTGPGIRELQALRSVDAPKALRPLDEKALERSAAMLDARSHSDDLRLPPPPKRSPSGAALYRTISSSVAKFNERAAEPVAADEDAVAAETRLMAACQGICSFQEQIFGNRDRPVGQIGQRALARRF